MISTEISQCRVASFRRLCHNGSRRGTKLNNNNGAGAEAGRSAGILRSQFYISAALFCSDGLDRLHLTLGRGVTVWGV